MPNFITKQISELIAEQMDIIMVSPQLSLEIAKILLEYIFIGSGSP